MKNTKTRLTLLVLALLVASSAGAYNTIGRWRTNQITMRASSSSFPAGNAFRTSLGTVVSRFNQNPSNQSFAQIYDDTSVALGNRQNEVWFSTSSQYNPAVTYYWKDSSGYMVEADVIFYSAVAWTASMLKTDLITYGGSRRPFETTAMHEFGHAAGLKHEEGEYNIMGADWNHIHLSGTTCRSYVGEDANAGLVELYGLYAAGVREDLAVTHFKYRGYSGEYSTHQPCGIFSAADALLLSSTVSGQRRYTVARGSQARVEFTYENLGESGQAVNVGFYVSPDAVIATTDRLIATERLVLSRADVDTLRHAVTIPGDLVAGQTYHLGVIVDYDNRFIEVDANNNAAHHVILVQ